MVENQNKKGCKPIYKNKLQPTYNRLQPKHWLQPVYYT